jgi:hypothetical protein
MGTNIMGINVSTIEDFLTLAAPLFTIMQGLAYLSYIVIAAAIVGSNLCTLFVLLVTHV